jgi:hypothetical protein
MGIDKTWALIPLVTPQNRHLADHSAQATTRRVSLWKRLPSIICTPKYTYYTGGIKVAAVTKVHDGTHKTYIITKNPRVKIQIYIQRFKSYIKQNSIRVRIKIQMGLRGLKINDGVHNSTQAKPEG